MCVDARICACEHVCVRMRMHVEARGDVECLHLSLSETLCVDTVSQPGRLLKSQPSSKGALELMVSVSP